jgi:hypothetical protein
VSCPPTVSVSSTRCSAGPAARAACSVRADLCSSWRPCARLAQHLLVLARATCLLQCRRRAMLTMESSQLGVPEDSAAAAGVLGAEKTRAAQRMAARRAAMTPEQRAVARRANAASQARSRERKTAAQRAAACETDGAAHARARAVQCKYDWLPAHVRAAARRQATARRAAHRAGRHFTLREAEQAAVAEFAARCRSYVCCVWVRATCCSDYQGACHVWARAGVTARVRVATD